MHTPRALWCANTVQFEYELLFCKRTSHESDGQLHISRVAEVCVRATSVAGCCRNGGMLTLHRCSASQPNFLWHVTNSETIRQTPSLKIVSTRLSFVPVDQTQSPGRKNGGRASALTGLGTKKGAIPLKLVRHNFSLVEERHTFQKIVMQSQHI